MTMPPSLPPSPVPPRERARERSRRWPKARRLKMGQTGRQKKKKKQERKEKFQRGPWPASGRVSGKQWRSILEY